MSEDEKPDEGEGGGKKRGKDAGPFPGEGIRMSTNGLKTYTAEQEKEQWRESVRVSWMSGFRSKSGHG